jgi:hypothetical protein
MGCCPVAVMHKYGIIGFLVFVHHFSTQRESNILGMGLVAVVQCAMWRSTWQGPGTQWH